ncbi:MAG TPA: sigma-70 family RNA polymerase sigma factor [Tepidisphaeraceae bacterium]|nr:sigma-70 family RNA polymerase sigma factor [Tepidisphaeraceae bacterium]
MATMTATKKTPTRAKPIPRVLRERAEALLLENYAFMDSPTFKQRGIEKQLFNFDGGEEPPLPMTSWYQPTREEIADQLRGTPQLMKGAEEKLMFQRFNFCKRKLCALQKRAKRGGLTRELAEELVEWHRRFEHFREYLVRTNLALVLAMAKRTRLGDVDFAEIVSEGNMALMRAVDKFNVDNGFKFSTYACRAILKAFSRTAMKSSRYKTHFPVEFEPEMEKSDWSDRKRDLIEEDCIDELKQIVDRNLADLSDTEQTVIRRRFNWQQQEENPLTLEEVGKIIGVTKERVRQIQNKALVKIKTVMEEGVLRTKRYPEPDPDAPVAPQQPTIAPGTQPVTTEVAA